MVFNKYRIGHGPVTGVSDSAPICSHIFHEKAVGYDPRSGSGHAAINTRFILFKERIFDRPVSTFPNAAQG